eukprot:NODE_69_length_2972_cov_17.748546_g53_i0.p1 GENE.NODE_69_length_2972_cov_17.748546_g53_i0~~NODE_69_length_2972_cov_17.748546_g53_i0.p1  ORF type:complete len:632 (+),score=194.30 NODE_69_length_2972_cov_17.748546_g53_i0:941-2836(+)
MRLQIDEVFEKLHLSEEHFQLKVKEAEQHLAKQVRDADDRIDDQMKRLKEQINFESGKCEERGKVSSSKLKELDSRMETLSRARVSKPAGAGVDMSSMFDMLSKDLTSRVESFEKQNEESVKVVHSRLVGLNDRIDRLDKRSGDVDLSTQLPPSSMPGPQAADVQKACMMVVEDRLRSSGEKLREQLSNELQGVCGNLVEERLRASQQISEAKIETRSSEVSRGFGSSLTKLELELRGAQEDIFERIRRLTQGLEDVKQKVQQVSTQSEGGGGGTVGATSSAALSMDVHTRRMGDLERQIAQIRTTVDLLPSQLEKWAAFDALTQQVNSVDSRTTAFRSVQERLQRAEARMDSPDDSGLVRVELALKEVQKDAASRVDTLYSHMDDNCLGPLRELKSKVDRIQRDQVEEASQLSRLEEQLRHVDSKAGAGPSAVDTRALVDSLQEKIVSVEKQLRSFLPRVDFHEALSGQHKELSDQFTTRLLQERQGWNEKHESLRKETLGIQDMKAQIKTLLKESQELREDLTSRFNGIQASVRKMIAPDFEKVEHEVAQHNKQLTALEDRARSLYQGLTKVNENLKVVQTNTKDVLIRQIENQLNEIRAKVDAQSRVLQKLPGAGGGRGGPASPAPPS